MVVRCHRHTVYVGPGPRSESSIMLELTFIAIGLLAVVTGGATIAAIAANEPKDCKDPSNEQAAAIANQ